MSQACINFARNADPSLPDMAWPRYDLPDRKTLIFDIPPRVVSDPDPERRQFWAA
jgi:para-nitrobenzyl esterase